ncbi:MAG: hypothetical protein J6Z46_03660, partial [Lachnospiraceae bacterium]|nr:hypothetical protein [Lachnospiraceae bacterium]
MEKTKLLTLSNFRKNKGTSVGLFLLMMLASMLVGVALLMFLDAYPTAEKEAKKLDAGDGYLWINKDIKGIDDAFIDELFKKDAKRYEAVHCLGYNNISLPFGKGTVAPGLAVSDSSAFRKTINRTEVIVEDTSVSEPYIYLPYQFYTSGGEKIGDVYSFELMGAKYDLNVRG